MNYDVISTLSTDDIINEYSDNYSILSQIYNINEFYQLYEDCKELLWEDNNINNIQYTDENFQYNGFIKSDFVIHEHDSKRAPLHWDLRWKTEFKTSAYSFVLLKHKMPSNDTERLLVKRQPMHPTQWVDMDHTQIGEGYGQGSVSTVDRGIIYYKMKDNSFTFYLKGKIYEGAYHLINTKFSTYLLFKAKNNILPTIEDRNNEWIQYAKNFIEYLNKIFTRKFNLLDNFIQYSDIIISNDEFDYEYNIHNNSSNILYIPNIRNMIDIKKSNQIKNITSTDCKINNIEDIMRLKIMRDYISPKFFNYLKQLLNNSNIIDIIFESVREIPYFDNELESIKNIDFNNYKQQKIYRMFSDIFLGHKYYGQFDFERFLIYFIKNNTKK